MYTCLEILTNTPEGQHEHIMRTMKHTHLVENVCLEVCFQTFFARMI